MTGTEVSDQLARHGVITLDHPRQAGPLGRALVAGGLACAEITFRTSAAEAGLSALAEDPSLLVGAGTVVSTDQADRAVAAGARFIVMPGFDARLVEHCRTLGVSVFPGVATASDVMAAVSAGLDTVKLFPAAIIGGTTILTALAAPFPGMRFIPIDWEHLFGTLGVRCLHTGGIFAALSPSTAALAEEAMRVARRCGTIVSYDLNYRPSLWHDRGGQPAARNVNRALTPHVDVLLGNEEDFTACLGFEVPGASPDFTGLHAGPFRIMIGDVANAYPDAQIVATTLREVRSATINDWGAIAWSRRDGFIEATDRPALEIFDRVGGGDSFASGLLYGLLELDDLGSAVEYGAAHGALAMTTPGDTSMTTLAEVRRLVDGAGARVRR
jgi:Entner-Doudoroff aldolase